MPFLPCNTINHFLKPQTTFYLLLTAFFILIPTQAYSTDYGSGIYVQSLSATAEQSTLSGNITINLSSTTPGSNAVFANKNGQVSGSVDSLRINLLGSWLIGIVSQEGGKIELDGPVVISNIKGLKQNNGIWTALDKGIHLTGPVEVTLQGLGNYGVASMPGKPLYQLR